MLLYCNDTLLEYLTSAVGDSALRKIVRGQLDRHAIPGYKANEMFPHLAGDMSYNLVAIFELHTKLRTREGFDNSSR